MRTQRSLLFSALFLIFATFSAAWPWPKWLPELDALVVRQDNNNNTPSSTTRAASTTSSSASRTTNNPSSTITNPPSTDSNGSTIKGTGSNTGSGSTTTKKSTTSTKKTTVYDARLPAGGVAMITPSVLDGEQYYKIGDFVTFRWNYTSLEATPTAVNIMATCKENNQLYTIAMNQTVSNATQAVTWDTGGYMKTNAADPLIVNKYTLIIYDAESSISAAAQAGYLAVYNQYSFGMYTPQPYVPLDQFVCVTCSGALGDMERKALGMVLGMSVLTVLSFTWFVAGTGIIW